jgi:RNA polymerase sigma factor (sigma-70 family)
MALAQEASSAVRLEPAASATAERLFQEHSGWIYGYCLRLLRSPEEAEDALQATYLNACRSLKTGFRPRTDSAWLMTVAHNVCITRLRSSGRRARVEHRHDATLLEETVPALERPADELIGLPEALAALPDHQRQAILLREWQGLSYREVAAKLRLTQAAVETLIFRARRSLAAALEDPVRRRQQTLRGFSLGGLGGGLKSLLGGSTTVKLAALAAAAATATVVATDPVGWHRPPLPDLPRADAVRAAPLAAKPESAPEAHAPAAEAEHRDLVVRQDAGAVRVRGTGHGRALGKPHAQSRAAEKAHPTKGKKAQAQGAAARQEHARSGKASGKPSFAGSGGPPPHASANASRAKER